MKTAIDFSSYDHIRPICLPKHYNDDNDYVATVTGWGKTLTADISNKLQEVNVNIISNFECQKHWGSGIMNQMICAYNKGTKGGGKNACNGDSGKSVFVD